jgi:hypothetical protein
MKTMKIFAVMMLGVFALSIMTAMALVAAVGPVTPPENINGNAYQGAIAAGEPKQMMFKNKFMLQVQANSSMNLAVECDVDAVGERNFSLALNSSNQAADSQLKIQIMANNSAVNMSDGVKLQAKNGNTYEFKNKYMMNVTLNGTDQLRATLRVDCNNENSTWAYLDEVTGEWVTQPSMIQDGELVCETDHFSLWTVLDLVPAEDGVADDGSTIDGYSILGILSALGIMGAVIIKKRH